MLAVSQRFLAGLAGVPRWVRMVEWSADGLTWSPLTVHSAKVTQDATSITRWTMDADVSGVVVGQDGLSPFGSLLRVRVGMQFSAGDVEWVPLGVYRCEKVRRALRSGVVSVSGRSLEASVVDAEFPAPRLIKSAASSVVIASLIQETIPSATVGYRLDDDPVTGRLTTTTSRWGVIDGSSGDPSVARALGAQVFCDRSGSFIVGEVPTLADDPVWTVDDGPGGVLVESAEELTREGLFNVVAARGETEGANTPPVGPAIASDTTATSVTYAWGDPGRGGLGPVVFHYSSPLLKTFAACQKAAKALLAPRLGLHQQLDWRAVVNPALDAGDVVLVRNPSGLTPTIIDSIDLDLGTMQMTSRCRAASTRLDDDVTALPASQDAS